MKRLLGLVLLAAIFLVSACETKESIVIEAPAAEVWAYLSDNNNAAEWSIYFKSIKTLSRVGDGDAAVGTVRRCYRGDNESAAYWDEVTLEARAEAYRKIITYNLNGFQGDPEKPMQFVVHNRYEKLSEQSTRLTFASEKLAPEGLLATLALKFVDSEAKDTLAKNLANIKAAVEARRQGKTYERPFPYVAIGSHPMDEYLAPAPANHH